MVHTLLSKTFNLCHPLLSEVEDDKDWKFCQDECGTLKESLEQD